MPVIYATDDYREVLRWHFRRQRVTLSRRHTVRFARIAGISNGHVRNVLTAERDLDLDLLEGFVAALELVGEAADYFRALVRAVHAPTPYERNLATQEVIRARAAHGFPRPAKPHSPGRPRRPLKDDEHAQLLFAWLPLRAWMGAGPLSPPAAATMTLDGALSAAQIERALDDMPDLARPPTRGAVPELSGGDPVRDAAINLGLKVALARLSCYKPPDRSLDTAHALIRAEDLGALEQALDEAWRRAVEEVGALAHRAADRRFTGPRHIHQLSVVAWASHAPFMTDFVPEPTCTDERYPAISAACGPDPSPIACEEDMKLPSPFDATDINALLTGWLQAKQARVPGYTVGRLARKIGCSDSHARNVFGGKRNITPEYIDDFGRAMGYHGAELRCFMLLCRLRQASSLGNRAHLLQLRVALHLEHGFPMPAGLAFAALMDPDNHVLCEATNAPGFRAEPAWVAEAMGWELKRAQAAVRALLGAGLARATPDGRLVKVDRDLSLPAHMAAPPVEWAQLRFAERAMVALATRGNRHAARLTNFALQVGDRLPLLQVAASLHHQLNRLLESLSKAALAAPGPYVVLGLQVAATPLSLALPPLRKTP